MIPANVSELQRQRVLKRWRKNDENDLAKSISNVKERRRLQVQLIAYLQGDGSVFMRKVKDNTRYDICFYPDNLKVAYRFVELYQKLYGRSLKIMPLPNYFVIRTTQRIAYEELSKLAKFHSLEWEVPIPLLDDMGKKKLWIRAFFDCEAHVSNASIVVQSVNKHGLKQIQSLLSEFGIKSNFYTYHRKQKTWNTNYLLCICQRESRETFLKQIGFNHSLKQEKLKISCRRRLTW